MKHIVTIKLLKTDSNMLNQSTKGIFTGNLGTGTVALGSGDGVGMGMGIITTGTVGDGDKSCPRAALPHTRHYLHVLRTSSLRPAIGEVGL